MTLIEGLLALLLGVVALSLLLVVCLREEIAGSYRLLSWMRQRLDSLRSRLRGTVSEKERAAIEEILNDCHNLGKEEINLQSFKSQTFSLIERIAAIYHPDASAPLEQARLGDILAALQEANQKVLNVMNLPRLDTMTRFRVVQVFPRVPALGKNDGGTNGSTIKNTVLGPLIRKIRSLIVKSLLVQWQLLAGEAAIKVYGENPTQGEPELEGLLAEWENVQEVPDVILPENVKRITESSKKEIVFSLTSITWHKAGQVYLALTEKIAGHYHSDSSAPLYEVRVCDLLESVSNSLDWASQLGQKPVLNKLLSIRIAHLTQAKEIALPFAEDKVMGWMKKYQVGRIAKWSRTFYRTLHKKQPGILFRDVVLGVVKEGGKRWLVLYLHGKVAEEANKLYSR